MVVGERRKDTASAYSNNPLKAYAEQFRNLASNVVQESQVDLFIEPARFVNNKVANETMKKFFVEGSYDPNGMTAAEVEDHIVTMEAQYDNDREAVLEHVYGAEMNPVIGMAFPLHKYILMNMVFDKGAIPKVVAQSPKFTVSMETRILVDTEGNEIDMFYEQNKMTAAIDKTAAVTEFDVDLPLTDDVELVHSKLGGLAGADHLSIETYVSAVKVEGVYFAEGDVLPDETTGYVEDGGVVATSDTAGQYDVWVRVNMQFNPSYGEIDRSMMQSFKYVCNKLDGKNVVETVLSDVISGTFQNDRLNIMSLRGNIKSVRVSGKLDTSNARATTCSVKWKAKTDIIEIPNAIPINTTVSPEEVKDINALYNVNQLTKIMSMFKTVLGNYKDDKIKENLDNSFKTLDARSKVVGSFDYAPREGYALDHVEWRHKTFFDYFDTQVTKLLQVLNDPNMVVTVFGDPDLVRKITPTDYSYQTPANIGPVDLDFTKTVVTSDRRCYQFIGSDKLRGNTELIVILCPRGTDRFIYRIYDYQLYISNEIRNADNPSLPAIHAFERWKFCEYQPVQGRINILNPSGIKAENYNSIRYKEVTE